MTRMSSCWKTNNAFCRTHGFSRKQKALRASWQFCIVKNSTAISNEENNGSSCLVSYSEMLFSPMLGFVSASNFKPHGEKKKQKTWDSLCQ